MTNTFNSTQDLAALTVALELGGGLLILSGWKSRWVALIQFLRGHDSSRRGLAVQGDWA